MTLQVNTLVFYQTFKNSKLIQTVKPIFHCNVKPHVLGSRIGLDHQNDDLSLPIPTCWYLKCLANPTRPPVYPTLLPIYPTRPPSTQRYPQCEQGEHRSRWVCESLIRIGHVHFMSFVHFFSRLECKIYSTPAQFLVEYML